MIAPTAWKLTHKPCGYITSTGPAIAPIGQQKQILISTPNNVGASLADHCIFLEPANALKALPDFYERNGTLVQVTGQFYTHKGFPQGYSSGEMPDVARIFRYTRFKIISTNLEKRQ